MPDCPTKSGLQRIWVAKDQDANMGNSWNTVISLFFWLVAEPTLNRDRRLLQGCRIHRIGLVLEDWVDFAPKEVVVVRIREFSPMDCGVEWTRSTFCRKVLKFKKALKRAGFARLHIKGYLAPDEYTRSVLFESGFALESDELGRDDYVWDRRGGIAHRVRAGAVDASLGEVPHSDLRDGDGEWSLQYWFARKDRRMVEYKIVAT